MPDCVLRNVRTVGLRWQIKDSIDFFVESNQDPDMAGQFEDEGTDMYEVGSGLEFPPTHHSDQVRRSCGAYPWLFVAQSLDLDDAPIQLHELGHRDAIPKRSPRDGGEDEEDTVEVEEVSLTGNFSSPTVRSCSVLKSVLTYARTPLFQVPEERTPSASKKDRVTAAKVAIPTGIGRYVHSSIVPMKKNGEVIQALPVTFSRHATRPQPKAAAGAAAPAKPTPSPSPTATQRANGAAVATTSTPKGEDYLFTTLECPKLTAAPAPGFCSGGKTDCCARGGGWSPAAHGATRRQDVPGCCRWQVIFS